EAEKVGIKIIIDLVINHTSSESIWFQGWLEGDSEYSGYYRKITSSDPRLSLTGSWGQGIWHATEGGYYCGYFSPSMPDLNWSNPAVQDEMIEVGKYWLEKGVDGFRLDAALHLEGVGEVMSPTDPFISTMEKLEYFEYMLSLDYPDMYIVSEVFDSFNVYSKFFEVLDSSLEFETGDLIINAINRGYDTSYTSTLNYWYTTIDSKSDTAIPAPFLKNHDQDRLASTWNGDFDKLSLAAEMYLVLPGNPFIYYGEELGMFGVKSTGPVWDETRRLPLPFGDSYTTSWFVDIYNTTLDNVLQQQVDETSLYNVYKNILQARHNSLALSYGDFVTYGGSSSALVGYYRVFNYDDDNQQAVLILHNLSDEPVIIYVDGNPIYYSGDMATFNNIVAPQSTIILEIEGYDFGSE
ncbi:MAG: alpha-amylase family glycosyl hydrolase, partial [Candidatus Izemoplasma sp.]